MTTAKVLETLVTVNNNSPIQDYIHPDDQTQTIVFKKRNITIEVDGRGTRVLLEFIPHNLYTFFIF